MKVAYIHFYVEDSRRSRNWFIETMGFESLGQNINSHTITEIVGINDVIFVISSPRNNISPVANYLESHPSGVADIAFYIEDFDRFYDKISTLNLKTSANNLIDQSHCKFITIRGLRGVDHTLIEQKKIETKEGLFKINNDKSFNFKHTPRTYKTQPEITYIDHVVLNVERYQLKDTVDWYRKVFDFEIQQLFTIETHYSGLYSEALIDSSGQLQFNINEPTSANSQIQDFLNFNRGSGIQHIALRTHNMIQTVQTLRLNNLQFLSVPNSYYRNLEEQYYQKIQTILTTKEWQELIANNILLDFSENNPQSLLMQIFTLPIFEKPTFFLELIERRQQAQGFGEGNFMALFQAIEKLSMDNYLVN